jgi:hypothetical protein
MVIWLLKDFFIEVEPKNYILKQKCTNKKTGEPVEKIYGYYSSLECLLKQYLKLAMIDKSVDEVFEWSELVSEIKDFCSQAIDRIKAVCEV